jgi:preprotein translocase subunit SecF
MYAFIISGVIVLVGFFALFQIANGRANLGVDFAGGTAVQIKFTQSVQLHDVRVALEQGGLKDFDLQDLRVRQGADPRKEAGRKSRRIHRVDYPDTHAEVSGTRSRLSIRRPRSAEGRFPLKQDALWAILYAIIGILAYIAFPVQIPLRYRRNDCDISRCSGSAGDFFHHGQGDQPDSLSALLTMRLFADRYGRYL